MSLRNKRNRKLRCLLQTNSQDIFYLYHIEILYFEEVLTEKNDAFRYKA